MALLLSQHGTDHQVCVVGFTFTPSRHQDDAFPFAFSCYLFPHLYYLLFSALKYISFVSVFLPEASLTSSFISSFFVFFW